MTPPRVLVVEDEQDIAALIKHTLERSGDASVATVGRGDEALRAVAELSPDQAVQPARAGGASPRRAAPPRREFELLQFLVENKNRVLSRDRLLERVWGYDRFVETRSVDVHVGRLRAKLGAAGQQIETVVGLGYRFIDASTG